MYAKQDRLPESVPILFKPKRPLRKHQVVGVKTMVMRECLGNFDEPGLGKSAQLLCTAGELISMRRADALLVVTKRTLIQTWKDEIQANTDFIPYIIAGRAVQDRKNIPLNYRVYVINYELLARSLCKKTDVMRGMGVKVNEKVSVKLDAMNILFLAQHRKMVIGLDESQALANPASDTSRVLLALGPYFPFRYVLSATPAADKVENIWAQMHFLDNGLLLGKSYPSFMAQYTVQSQGMYGSVVTGYRNQEELNKRIRHASIRRYAKDCLDLPPKIVCSRKITCEGKHSKVMLQLRDRALSALSRYSDDTIYLNKDEPLARTIQSMQRAAVAPWLVEGFESIRQSCKLDLILDMMDEIPGSVVIWSVHRDVCEAIASVLTKAGVAARYAHGGVSHKERDRLLDDFTNKKFKAISVTIASMKEGVNKMIVAQNAIYAQQDWSTLAWEQSQGRLFRMGQTGKVVISNIIMERSLDQFIRTAVDRKQQDITEVVDGVQTRIRINRMRFMDYLKLW